MTAKEKAQELIQKFSGYAFSTGVLENYCVEVERKNAVECAKLAVQEILDLDVMWHSKEIQKDYPRLYSPEQTREFWEEVMEELKK